MFTVTSLEATSTDRVTLDRSKKLPSIRIDLPITGRYGHLVNPLKLATDLVAHNGPSHSASAARLHLHGPRPDHLDIGAAVSS